MDELYIHHVLMLVKKKRNKEETMPMAAGKVTVLAHDDLSQEVYNIFGKFHLKACAWEAALLGHRAQFHGKRKLEAILGIRFQSSASRKHHTEIKHLKNSSFMIYYI